jgi:CheY-like chemotaxis protein
MKVMLIEDDRTMRMMLKTLLELEKFTVSFWNGQPSEDIITLIKTDHPDVLLLDVHLRTISGLDILRQVRADEKIKSIRIIMTSGMDLCDQCMESGADGFLLKPYMPDELIQMIRPQS